VDVFKNLRSAGLRCLRCLLIVLLLRPVGEQVRVRGGKGHAPTTSAADRGDCLEGDQPAAKSWTPPGDGPTACHEVD